ncbi:hypothetical protein SIM91_05795 [Rhodococcus opacus]|uniref:Uncharacterized protein n=1 Tax=Rhodococcus opacus TaxID=37919 RepID=A0AAX3YPS7_RHOOP|nr:hypothetical protein [Rhodococcus opacus]ELB90649.1 hypothetical protein Rwratislav_23274 [Rhodococcus wratislaviensis IFP 2016]MCZ4589603.1 hypothetical protein [Rhodococcus opacus]MDX5962827.1 hypothetical protein [Rhodococcus opacus]WLF51238.1 hypothetical protein Q5707_38395 [Rhodococcus opacus]CAG7637474.1 hypothetical protein E143388_07898 [Rhodococcus opacus]
MNIFKYVLWVAVGLGVFRGWVNWSESEGVDSTTIIRIFETVVNTIADLTYQWIPALLGLIDGGLTSQPDSGPTVESLAPLTMEVASW